MICGERGHVGKDGRPCRQNINAKAAGCVWHVLSPEGRSAMALKGSVASRMKRALPSSYQIPEFESPEAIIAFARELARLALTGDVDMRRVGEARQAAMLALSGHSAQTQARLVEALVKIEGGGAAFVMLQRLQEGLSEGRRRPLPSPGRVLPMPPPDGAA